MYQLRTPLSVTALVAMLLLLQFGCRKSNFEPGKISDEAREWFSWAEQDSRTFYTVTPAGDTLYATSSFGPLILVTDSVTHPAGTKLYHALAVSETMSFGDTDIRIEYTLRGGDDWQQECLLARVYRMTNGNEVPNPPLSTWRSRCWLEMGLPCAGSLTEDCINDATWGDYQLFSSFDSQGGNWFVHFGANNTDGVIYCEDTVGAFWLVQE